MKKIIFLISFVVLLSLAFAQSSLLDSFTATSNGSDVTLDWRSSNESNISSFDIERAPDTQQFKYLGTVKSRGYANSYNYKDDNAFMKGNGSNNITTSNKFSYRLKIIHKDNSFEYTNNVMVIHNVSGFKKTWGMLKAIFD